MYFVVKNNGNQIELSYSLFTGNNLLKHLEEPLFPTYISSSRSSSNKFALFLPMPYIVHV